MQFRCPNCNHPIQIAEPQTPGSGKESNDRKDAIECPSCHSRISLSADAAETVISEVGRFVGMFSVQRVLGEGAFGTVYLARDENLQRSVAVKIPRRDRIRGRTAADFLKEARSAARVRHPNIVQVFEVGQRSEGPYIVSEYIDGISLSEWLKIRTLLPRDAAALSRTISAAVQAAHDAGVVHRDLKPGNILMDLQDQPHITDFGLATVDDAGEITVTQDGHIVGTPAYMSPEQARGENTQINHLSDVWALGVILYELLTGRRPFEASSSHTVLYQIVTEEPVSPSKLNRRIPVELSTITRHAMNKDPKKRYQSAKEMADDLQRFLDGRSIIARPAGLIERGRKLIARNRLVSGLTGLLLLSLLVLAAQTFFSRRAVHADLAPVPAVPDNTRPVTIACETPSDVDGAAAAGALWAIVPLDELTRLPDTQNIVRTGPSGTFNGRLSPGEYLVVVSVDGLGFHEVYRSVPENNTESLTLPYNHQRYDIDAAGQIVLPAVTIFRESDVTGNMAFLKGGRFLMGDDRIWNPKHEQNVDDFYLDSTEVTVMEYEKLFPLNESYILPRGTYPIAERSWHQAIAFAELSGKRLPSEAEFEYGATSSGRRPPVVPVVPSINVAASNVAPNTGDASTGGATQGAEVVIAAWGYGEAGEPATDRHETLPLFGLHSNVAEWVDSLQLPYPGTVELTQQYAQLIGLRESRVVRGGPVIQGPNDRTQNTWNEPPSARMAFLATTMDSEIGFRCARSATPRFLKP